MRCHWSKVWAIGVFLSRSENRRSEIGEISDRRNQRPEKSEIGEIGDRSESQFCAVIGRRSRESQFCAVIGRESQFCAIIGRRSGPFEFSCRDRRIGDRKNRRSENPRSEKSAIGDRRIGDRRNRRSENRIIGEIGDQRIEDRRNQRSEIGESEAGENR